MLHVEMNCLIKKRPYKTDKSHVLSGKTHTFHVHMFLIPLIQMYVRWFMCYTVRIVEKWLSLWTIMCILMLFICTKRFIENEVI